MDTSKTINYGFRIVHIENIPYIEEFGFVLPSSPLASKDYKAIGDTKVIEKRKLQQHGIDLTKYIPFYLGPRSVMLFVIQNGYNGVVRQAPQDILYCVVKIKDLIINGVNCIFTDGHALSAITQFYTHEYLPKLNEIISFDDVYACNWKNEDDTDLKRRKEAELLIYSDLPSTYICGYIVYDEKSREKLIQYGIDEKRIVVKPDYYFKL